MTDDRQTTPHAEPPPFPDGDPLGEPPPDWDVHGPPPRGAHVDLSAVFVLLDALRRAAPRELQGQLTAFVREVLLTLRALIDWYLERLDGGARRPPVEDIPID